MIRPGAGVGEDSIDEYRNQKKSQSGSSMPTVVVLPDMYVPDMSQTFCMILESHIRKLLTLGQPVLALDDFGMSMPVLGLI